MAWFAKLNADKAGCVDIEMTAEWKSHKQNPDVADAHDARSSSPRSARTQTSHMQIPARADAHDAHSSWARSAGSLVNPNRVACQIEDGEKVAHATPSPG